MDFHSLKRKELQILCKKHGIPANLKNVEMADRLASLLVKEEKPEKQGKRGRSCLKNMSEVIEIEDDEKVVDNKEVKKVRFSPENQTFVFERTDPRAGRLLARKKRVSEESCKEKNPVVVSENSKECGSLSGVSDVVTRVEEILGRRDLRRSSRRKCVVILDDEGSGEENRGESEKLSGNEGDLDRNLRLNGETGKEELKRRLRPRAGMAKEENVEVVSLLSPVVENKVKRGRKGEGIVEGGCERVNGASDKMIDNVGNGGRVTRRPLRNREVTVEVSESGNHHDADKVAKGVKETSDKVIDNANNGGRVTRRQLKNKEVTAKGSEGGANDYVDGVSECNNNPKKRGGTRKSSRLLEKVITEEPECDELSNVDVTKTLPESKNNKRGRRKTLMVIPQEIGEDDKVVVESKSNKRGRRKTLMVNRQGIGDDDEVAVESKSNKRGRRKTLNVKCPESVGDKEVEVKALGKGHSMDDNALENSVLSTGVLQKRTQHADIDSGSKELKSIRRSSRKAPKSKVDTVLSEQVVDTDQGQNEETTVEKNHQLMSTKRPDSDVAVFADHTVGMNTGPEYSAPAERCEENDVFRETALAEHKADKLDRATQLSPSSSFHLCPLFEDCNAAGRNTQAENVEGKDQQLANDGNLTPLLVEKPSSPPNLVKDAIEPVCHSAIEFTMPENEGFLDPCSLCETQGDMTTCLTESRVSEAVVSEQYHATEDSVQKEQMLDILEEATQFSANSSHQLSPEVRKEAEGIEEKSLECAETTSPVPSNYDCSAPPLVQNGDGTETSEVQQHTFNFYKVANVYPENVNASVTPSVIEGTPGSYSLSSVAAEDCRDAGETVCCGTVKSTSLESIEVTEANGEQSSISSSKLEKKMRDSGISESKDQYKEEIGSEKPHCLGEDEIMQKGTQHADMDSGAKELNSIRRSSRKAPLPKVDTPLSEQVVDADQDQNENTVEENHQLMSTKRPDSDGAVSADHIVAMDTVPDYCAPAERCEENDVFRETALAEQMVDELDRAIQSSPCSSFHLCPLFEDCNEVKRSTQAENGEGKDQILANDSNLTPLLVEKPFSPPNLVKGSSEPVCDSATEFTMPGKGEVTVDPCSLCETQDDMTNCLAEAVGKYEGSVQKELKLDILEEATQFSANSSHHLNLDVWNKAEGYEQISPECAEAMPRVPSNYDCPSPPLMQNGYCGEASGVQGHTFGLHSVADDFPENVNASVTPSVIKGTPDCTSLSSAAAPHCRDAGETVCCGTVKFTLLEIEANWEQSSHFSSEHEKETKDQCKEEIGSELQHCLGEDEIMPARESVNFSESRSCQYDYRKADQITNELSFSPGDLTILFGAMGAEEDNCQEKCEENLSSSANGSKLGCFTVNDKPALELGEDDEVAVESKSNKRGRRKTLMVNQQEISDDDEVVVESKSNKRGRRKTLNVKCPENVGDKEVEVKALGKGHSMDDNAVENSVLRTGVLQKRTQHAEMDSGSKELKSIRRSSWKAPKSKVDTPLSEQVVDTDQGQNEETTVEKNHQLMSTKRPDSDVAVFADHTVGMNTVPEYCAPAERCEENDAFRETALAEQKADELDRDTQSSPSSSFHLCSLFEVCNEADRSTQAENAEGKDKILANDANLTPLLVENPSSPTSLVKDAIEPVCHSVIEFTMPENEVIMDPCSLCATQGDMTKCLTESSVSEAVVSEQHHATEDSVPEEQMLDILEEATQFSANSSHQLCPEARKEVEGIEEKSLECAETVSPVPSNYDCSAPPLVQNGDGTEASEVQEHTLNIYKVANDYPENVNASVTPSVIEGTSDSASLSSVAAEDCGDAGETVCCGTLLSTLLESIEAIEANGEQPSISSSKLEKKMRDNGISESKDQCKEEIGSEKPHCLGEEENAVGAKYQDSSIVDDKLQVPARDSVNFSESRSCQSSCRKADQITHELSFSPGDLAILFGAMGDEEDDCLEKSKENLFSSANGSKLEYLTVSDKPALEPAEVFNNFLKNESQQIGCKDVVISAEAEGSTAANINSRERCHATEDPINLKLKAEFVETATAVSPSHSLQLDVPCNIIGSEYLLSNDKSSTKLTDQVNNYNQPDAQYMGFEDDLMNVAEEPMFDKASSADDKFVSGLANDGQSIPLQVNSLVDNADLNGVLELMRKELDEYFQAANCSPLMPLEKTSDMLDDLCDSNTHREYDYSRDSQNRGDIKELFDWHSASKIGPEIASADSINSMDDSIKSQKQEECLSERILQCDSVVCKINTDESLVMRVSHSSGGTDKEAVETEGAVEEASVIICLPSIDPSVRASGDRALEVLCFPSIDHSVGASGDSINPKVIKHGRSFTEEFVTNSHDTEGGKESKVDAEPDMSTAGLCVAKEQNVCEYVGAHRNPVQQDEVCVATNVSPACKGLQELLCLPREVGESREVDADVLQGEPTTSEAVVEMLHDKDVAAEGVQSGAGSNARSCIYGKDDTYAENVKALDAIGNTDNNQLLAKTTKRSILIHGTPRKPLLHTHALKENILSPKRSEMVNATARRPLLNRKPLGEI